MNRPVYKMLEKTGKNEPQWTLGFCNCRCTRSWRGNFYRKYTFHTIISRKHTIANGGQDRSLYLSFH